MTAATPSFFRAISRYAVRIRTLRDEIRTERFLASLPADIRKDIGWPGAHGRRRPRA